MSSSSGCSRSQQCAGVRVARVMVGFSMLGWLVTAAGSAQTPARGATPQQPARGGTLPAPGRGSSGAAGAKIEANLAQLMRGIVYPSSNVIFAAQDDLGKYPPARDPSTSPNLLTSTYGGWQAVESAALALAESANLILLPDRLCSNGKPVPVKRADWAKYAQGLRDAGVAAYKAAQSKNQDAMVDVAGTVADACSACHEVYREKSGGLKDRCLP